MSCSDLEQQSVHVQVFGLDWSKPDPSLVVSADETGFLDFVKYFCFLHIFQICDKWGGGDNNQSAYQRCVRSTVLSIM